MWGREVKAKCWFLCMGYLVSSYRGCVKTTLTVAMFVGGICKNKIGVG